MAACLFTMKTGIQGQEQGLILHLFERFGCTTPVGLNFLTDGLSTLATQLRSLGHTRWTRLFIGGVMGDQQEGDRYTTGEPCVCHHCFAHRHQYLDTVDFEVKTMRKVRARVEFAAAGGHLKGSKGTRVVRWNPGGRGPYNFFPPFPNTGENPFPKHLFSPHWEKGQNRLGAFCRTCSLGLRVSIRASITNRMFPDWSRQPQQ
jgi:hypothetical protein